MSDVPQGPGWWQASDDKWYPPPRPEMPGEEEPPPTTPVTSSPSGGYAPPGAPSSGEYPPQAQPPQTQVPPGAPTPSGPYGPPVQGPPVVGGPGASGGFGGPASPYSGMPPSAPPPGAGQNRTPLFIVLGVLGALLLVVLLVVLTSGDDDDTTAGSTTTSVTASNQTVPSPTSPDDTTEDTQAPPTQDDAIRLADNGFTVPMDELSEQAYASYGVLLENTTDQVATSIDITIGFLDASGTVVGSDSQTLNVIMPGQTLGIGNSGIEVDGDPVEMQVDYGEPTWDSPSDYGVVTANGINTTVDDWGAPTTHFTAESTYEEQLDGPYAYAVYRNAAGEIIGGNWGSLNFVQANGSSTGEVVSLYTIEGLDDAATEVYIDPGYLS